ncbi:MAG: N-acetylglucosamine-6-phosphate deacetylase [Halioglobus sp.]|nr:N-acetylglucosamine-6-phosphate deacetylase [Halioglobus sp.]
MPTGATITAVSAPALFDGDTMLQDHCVLLQGERIHALLPVADCPVDVPLQSLGQGTLAPGFVDLQVNGGGDVMFNTHTHPAGLASMLAAHRSRGSTAILPTLLSDTRPVQEAAFAAVCAARAAGNAGILGIHFEGPWFNPEHRGAHRQDRLRRAEPADVDWLCGLEGGGVVMLTLAPERVPGALLQKLAESGVLVCAGHTQASFAQLSAAAGCGLRGITHLFNAMSQLRGREPGTVGAALALDGLWAGIIADGHHVHAAAIRLAARCKPPGKLILVSDAMATVGGSSAAFSLYDEEIRQVDGRLVNAEGVLAGSAIGLIDAVRYCQREVGLPLEECLRMASRYPAVAIGLGDTLGCLHPGYRADLVHFDDDLNVIHTWLAGEQQTHRQPPTSKRNDP